MKCGQLIVPVLCGCTVAVNEGSFQAIMHEKIVHAVSVTFHAEVKFQVVHSAGTLLNEEILTARLSSFCGVCVCVTNGITLEWDDH